MGADYVKGFNDGLVAGFVLCSTVRGNVHVSQILIEFGGEIGLPYGREPYTRTGHIEIMGTDGVDYGLNTNGAKWTASSQNSPWDTIYAGVAEPQTHVSMFRNSGLKWYRCELPIPQKLITLSAFSGCNLNDPNWQDFPQSVKITLTFTGETTKIIDTIFTKPTAKSQRNVIVPLT